RRLHIVDPKSGKTSATLEPPSEDAIPRSVVLPADGKTAAVCWEKFGLVLYDLKVSSKPPGQKLAASADIQLSFSANGRFLGGAGDGEVLLWNMQTRRLHHTFPVKGKRGPVFLSAPCLTSDGGKLAVTEWAAEEVYVFRTDPPTELTGFVSPNVGCEV